MTTENSDAMESDRPQSRVEQIKKKGQELIDEVQRVKELVEYRNADSSDRIDQKGPDSS